MLQNNIALITVRRIEDSSNAHFFCTNEISVLHSTSAKEGNFVFPLYLYPNGKLPDGDLFVREEPGGDKRRPNLNAAFIKDFCARLHVTFVPNSLGKPSKREVGPESILTTPTLSSTRPATVNATPNFCARIFPGCPLRRITTYSANWRVPAVISSISTRGARETAKASFSRSKASRSLRMSATKRRRPMAKTGTLVASGSTTSSISRASCRPSGAFPSAATVRPSVG